MDTAREALYLNTAAETLQSIKDNWPKFPVKKENILKPNSAFVTKFYNEFLRELYRYIQVFTDEEVLFNDPPGLMEFSEEIITYNRMLQVFSVYLIKQTSYNFLLSDILKPQPKRTRVFITLCMQILMTINEIIKSDNNIYKEEMSKKDSFHDVSRLKAEVLEKLNWAQEKLEESEENLYNLRKEGVEVNKEYLEVLEYEKTRNKLYKDKQKEIDSLISESNMLKYDLDAVKKENVELEEQVVSQSEYEKDLEVLENLEKEIEGMTALQQTLSHGLEAKNKTLLHNNKCINVLETLVFDTKCEQIMREDEGKLQKLQFEIPKLNTELSDLTSTTEKLKMEEDLLNQKVEFIEKERINQLIIKQKECKDLQMEYTQLNQHNKQLEENKAIEIKQLEKELKRKEESFEHLKNSVKEKKTKLIELEKQVVQNFTVTMEQLLTKSKDIKKIQF
ncbi:unnamed protein product [Brassicogethes aeneus]|uniref:Kinetochore protein Nuf2 N-terminal domain-containing protein n=1 Tax=Brassicogethes aeneus TaxID=1431903 RepID=A0A9P0FD04_BRAAE|nr:unnamed protein product [Brassicogethes aeneus]